MTRYDILLGKEPPKPQIVEYFMGIDPGVSSTEVIVGHIVMRKSELSSLVEYAFQIDLQEQLTSSQSLGTTSSQSLETTYAWFERIYHKYNSLGKLKVRTDQMSPAYWLGNHLNIPCEEVKINSSWRVFLYDACRVLRVSLHENLREFQQAYDLALSLAIDKLQSFLEPRDFDPEPKYSRFPKDSKATIRFI
jgi:hypothetical protein